MVKVWDVVIPTLSSDNPRRAYVYLPKGYEKGERRYPVLYMFDGHNLFFDEHATYGKSWGMAEYLESNSTPLIVAAVECNHDGNNRLSEYSPVDFVFKNGEKIKGRGKAYMDWLVNTFKPYIDENYLTLKDRAHTAIAGSSMGGLMTFFALAKYNKYFSRGAALSPSLWAYGTSLVSFIEKGSFGKDTVLYTDYGSKEFNGVRSRQGFADAVRALIDKNVLVTARIVEGGTHCESSWEKQIPFFIKALGLD